MSEDWVEAMSPEDRERWDEFVDDFRRNAVENIAGSDAFISLVPHGEWDVKFAVELGAAIMMDKPILAVVQTGAAVPEKLRLVSEEVVEVDIDTTEGRAELAQAINRLLERRSG